MHVHNNERTTEPTPTPTPNAHASAKPRIDSVIGPWRIDSKLGNGTTAYVYAATNLKNGQRAALKILRTAHVDDVTRRRFAREGYVANAVGHPGVVRIFDQGVTDDGALYIVMELLDGESLDSLRHRHGGRLPIDRVVDIGCDLLDAIGAAHGRNVIHRDLKPANVFVTADGSIKVLDFGLANISNPDRASSITRSGIMIGTPAFMPPEQARGKVSEVDARSDVFSLGATLFTLITGRAVHVAASTSGQMLASLTKPAPSLQSVAPQVSKALASVIDRALAFERKDRFEDAEAMGKALRAARASGLESSTPVVTSHEGVTPVATVGIDSGSGLGLPSLADECDNTGPTRVAEYSALALVTSPEAHRDVVVKLKNAKDEPRQEHTLLYEPNSLAPAQRTVPPVEPMPDSDVLPAAPARARWVNAFAGVCAALVAGGITLAVIASAERIRARSHATASAQPPAASMLEAPPVVLDPVPEPPASAAIVVEPLPVAEPPPPEPTAAPAPEVAKTVAPSFAPPSVAPPRPAPTNPAPVPVAANPVAAKPSPLPTSAAAAAADDAIPSAVAPPAETTE